MSCIWPTVFPKSILFRNVGVEINQRWNQDVGGIHDLVAHDDVSKGHVAELLLGVRLHWLYLSLSYKHRWKITSGTFLKKVNTKKTLEFPNYLPPMSFSTQVNVMPPSLLLSLKRSRKVPGGFGLRMALSLSLLIKPMMYLVTGKLINTCTILKTSPQWSHWNQFPNITSKQTNNSRRNEGTKV